MTTSTWPYVRSYRETVQTPSDRAEAEGWRDVRIEKERLAGRPDLRGA